MKEIGCVVRVERNEKKEKENKKENAETRCPKSGPLGTRMRTIGKRMNNFAKLRIIQRTLQGGYPVQNGKVKCHELEFMISVWARLVSLGQE